MCVSLSLVEEFNNHILNPCSFNKVLTSKIIGCIVTHVSLYFFFPCFVGYNDQMATSYHPFPHCSLLFAHPTSFSQTSSSVLVYSMHNKMMLVSFILLLIKVCIPPTQHSKWWILMFPNTLSGVAPTKGSKPQNNESLHFPCGPRG